ncbi:MAG TPA: hypothetical protein PK894_05830 [Defluviitoga sp.]|nr:hypothetical protein [Defluviitoga sp.]HOP25035.1 hypothetical protein [Defluviitoga sp.]HPZ29187.1 hypothetical protein [Defluviitoga sp.]HQD63094.1 hypothetical protein [Defluviitoga sp.]
MNKKVLVLVLFVTLSVISLTQTYTFLFRDAQLHYVTTDQTTFQVPEGFEVLWVTGVNSWSLEKTYQQFSFKIVSLEDFKNKTIQQIDENIFKIDGTNDILFYNSQINHWCTTNEKNKDKIKASVKIVLEKTKNKTATIALQAPGTWKIVYEMKKDGTFKKNIEINGKAVGTTNLYLVNEYLNLSPRDYVETTKALSTLRLGQGTDFQTIAQEAILTQTYTISLGNIKFVSDIMNFSISENKVLSYEDRNVITFNLYTNIQDFTKTRLVRYFENTKHNGLGIDLPYGEVWIYEQYDDKNFPIKKTNIYDTPIDDIVKIDLGESWDVQYKFEKLSDVEVKTADTRIIDFLITIKNFSDKIKVVQISAAAPNLEIDQMKIDGGYRGVKDNSQKGKIDLSFELTDQVIIRMTVKTTSN